MMKGIKFLAIVVGVVTLITLSACKSDAKPNTLVSIKATPASMAVDDAVWAKAPALLAKTGMVEGTKSSSDVDVEVKSVHDGENLWFRYQWADATQSDYRRWEFDGSTWNLAHHGEDRLGVFWEITPIKQFASKGATVLCHNEGNNPDDWYMIAPGADDRADRWQWKASRTAAAGYADDKWLSGGVLPDPSDRESAAHGDEKTMGGAAHNNNADKTAPLKMQDPNITPSAGSHALLASEAVDFDPTAFKAGDSLPAWILSTPDGSFGDVSANSSYADGKWTVVFERKLNTGHDDDVQFNTSRSYPFGIAIFEDTGDENHTVSQDPLTLSFK